jgi:hypothetical protein
VLAELAPVRECTEKVAARLDDLRFGPALEKNAEKLKGGKAEMEGGE